MTGEVVVLGPVHEQPRRQRNYADNKRRQITGTSIAAMEVAA
jgi:hypothetical protein